MNSVWTRRKVFAAGAAFLITPPLKWITRPSEPDMESLGFLGIDQDGIKVIDPATVPLEEDERVSPDSIYLGICRASTEIGDKPTRVIFVGAAFQAPENCDISIFGLKALNRLMQQPESPPSVTTAWDDLVAWRLRAIESRQVARYVAQLPDAKSFAGNEACRPSEDDEEGSPPEAPGLNL